MQKFFNKKGQSGFTLVELMVVLVIIGILATMAIPRFMGASRKTKATECKPVLKEIYTLQTAYQMERNAFAATVDELGFEAPQAAVVYYTYTATNNAARVGIASVSVAARQGDLGLTAARDACINNLSVIQSDHAELGGLINVPVNAGDCP